MKIKNKPAAIILDWDNTIVEAEKIYVEIMSRILDELNLKTDVLETEIMKKHRHLPINKLFPMIFGNKWEIARKIHDDIVIDHLNKLNYESLLEKAIDFIEIVYKDNLSMSIVSNKASPLLKMEINKLKMEKYFKKIVGAGDTALGKPSADPAYMALKGVTSEEEYQNIWFIGDSFVDIECAINIGCKPFLIKGKKKEIERLSELGIEADRDYIIAPNFAFLINMYNNIKNM